MARINHLLVLGLAILMVAQSYANLHYDGAYVYMTNHPKHMDHPVYVNNAIGPEAKSTNYETRFNGDVCYNLTNYVLEDKGSVGNHRWVEVTFGEDCVAGLIIEEHKMTEKEPFSACYTFQYKRYMYFGDHERPPTCTPAMYEYHVIFTLSKDPDENVKQMVKKYVQENNIRRLYRMNHSGVAGRAIVEHRLTEEEPFSVFNVYWYNRYFDDSENPPTCTPDMYNYRVIFTRSKYPDENVKEMIDKFVEENNINGLYKQGPSECDI